MFGSTPGIQVALTNTLYSDDDPTPKPHFINNAGKLLLYCGQRLVVHSLRPRGLVTTKEYELPGLENSRHVATIQEDILAFCSTE